MSIALHIGDCRAVLATLPAASVHCVVTSPPYWGLRDYGTATWEGGEPGCEHTGVARRCDLPGRNDKQSTQRGSSSDRVSRDCLYCGATRIDAQLGLEPDFNAYVANMVAVFREVRRVLRDDGTLWLNLGDSYASQGGYRDYGSHDNYVGRGPTGGQRPVPSNGLKPKDLCGIPWRVAFALQADGWYLRQDIIWSKPNPMPESVTDRCTKAHEYLFLLSKRERYYYDAEAIKEPIAESQIGRVRSDVIGGKSWKERQQHGVGGTYETGSSGTNGGLLALPWEPGERAGADGKSRTSLCAGPKMARSDELLAGQFRNRRSVWEIPTAPFSEAHFATFPPALIEPCIKAGTSEKGCCGKCGKPWVRQTEYGQVLSTGGSDKGMRASNMASYDPSGQHTVASAYNTGNMVQREKLTTGWQPSCACAADPVPCTVLDCFAGAGTTGLVTDRLQRNAILIELNPTYAAMSSNRIKDDAPLFADVAQP